VFEQLEAAAELVCSSSTPAGRAAEIVAEARARAVAIEEEARRAGREAGFAEGLERAAEEARGPLAALAAAADAVAAARLDAAAAVEARAAELALLVAEKVVAAALEVRPELVCEVVAGALRRVVEHDRLVVEVNPEDAERVRAWAAAGADRSLDALDVRAERRVPRGGCVVRTAELEIDARVAEQLERAGEVVREALGSAP